MKNSVLFSTHLHHTTILTETRSLNWALSFSEEVALRGA